MHFVKKNRLTWFLDDCHGFSEEHPCIQILHAWITLSVRLFFFPLWLSLLPAMLLLISGFVKWRVAPTNTLWCNLYMQSLRLIYYYKDTIACHTHIATTGMQQQMISVTIRMAMQRHMTKSCSWAHTVAKHQPTNDQRDHLHTDAVAQDQAMLTSAHSSKASSSTASLEPMQRRIPSTR